MQYVQGTIRWASRVNPQDLLRLYHSDAQGFRDTELVDQVGYAILSRVHDVIAATEAHYGRAACPVCGAIISHEEGNLEEILCCPCGFAMPWRDYFHSYQGKKLHYGGARPALDLYVRSFTIARSYEEKMRAIDALVHTFHYELQGRERFSRPVAANILYGKAGEILDTLNALAYSSSSTGELECGLYRYENYRVGAAFSAASLDPVPVEARETYCLSTFTPETYAPAQSVSFVRLIPLEK